jgi:hypothetical protein
MFNTPESINANYMTQRQIEQGKVLLAFAMALQVPAVMEALQELVAEITKEAPAKALELKLQ